MPDIKEVGFVAAAILLFFAFGIVSESDYREQVKAEDHAAWVARQYILRDRGRAEEELRELRTEAAYAELRERLRKK